MCFEVRVCQAFTISRSLSSSLHIAMQIGLYHPRKLDQSLWLGVQSLRILPSRTFSRVRWRAFPADCPHLRIFTATARWRVPEDSRSFQHIAKFIYVTTTGHLSIVTAAVYWGFDQELCLAADPIN